MYDITDYTWDQQWLYGYKIGISTRNFSKRDFWDKPFFAFLELSSMKMGNSNYRLIMGGLVFSAKKEKKKK